MNFKNPSISSFVEVLESATGGHLELGMPVSHSEASSEMSGIGQQ